jgi:hypothetical protein
MAFLIGETRKTCRKSLIRFLGRPLFQASGSKETPELVREAQPTEKKKETKSGQNNTLGRVFLVIALAIVLCVRGTRH